MLFRSRTDISGCASRGPDSQGCRSSAVERGQDVDVEIATVSKAKVGGLDVFQYVALIDGGEEVTQESSLVAIQHNRIVKVALNHYQGALDDTAKDRITSLFKSLRFDLMP